MIALFQDVVYSLDNIDGEVWHSGYGNLETVSFSFVL